MYSAMFENDVKMYGIQTSQQTHGWKYLFENDVKMYGIQTCAETIATAIIVWEWCKNVWYSNLLTLIAHG